MTFPLLTSWQPLHGGAGWNLRVGVLQTLRNQCMSQVWGSRGPNFTLDVTLRWLSSLGQTFISLFFFCLSKDNQEYRFR